MMTSEPAGPILAIDVQYVDTPEGTTGYASGVLFDTFASATATAVYTVICPDIAPYEPGSFFKRELPPVLAVISACPTPPAVVIVDGFVDVKPGKPGLGRHLFERRGGIVIGVAKNPFRDGRREKDGEERARDGERGRSASEERISQPTQDDDQNELQSGAILRGSSSRALYVTSAGIDQRLAERLVAGMHGRNRIPTMLKLVDAEARRAAKAGSG